METIKSKIRNLLELSKRPGSEFEGANAKQLIQKLLDKYHLTMDDIVDSHTSIWRFKYNTAHEKNLLFQTCAKVLNCGRLKYGQGKNCIAIEITKLQGAEITYLFEVYKKHWRKEFNRLKKELDKQTEILYQAFIHKNKIFSESGSSGSEEMELTEKEIEELKQVINAMQNMKRVEIRKVLNV